MDEIRVAGVGVKSSVCARLSSMELGRIEVVRVVGVYSSVYDILGTSTLYPRLCCNPSLSLYGGDAAGGWGRGRRDCRTLLYGSGLDPALLRAFRFSVLE
jgi:hypothetical protein